jgi:hypothetical protein
VLGIHTGTLDVMYSHSTSVYCIGVPQVRDALKAKVGDMESSMADMVGEAGDLRAQLATAQQVR